MGDKATKARLSFSFPETMREKLAELAEKKSMKLTTYIKMVIDIHVKKIIAKRS